MKGRKPSLLIIFLTVFIDLIGFGIVLPLLPRYSELYGARGLMIGAIIASFSVMQFLLAPAWGRLSDRIGRRPVLLLSNAGSTLSYALFGWAVSGGWSPPVALGLILLSRIFAGACGANISVASAYIADITPPEKRSKGMALIGVAFGLGFILGPAIGGLSLKWLGLAAPGWVAAGLCGANFLLATVILAESRQAGSPRAPGRPGLDQWRRVLSRPHAGLLVKVYFLATFCFACFESTLPLLLASPAFHPDDFPEPKRLARALNEDASLLAAAVRAGLPEEIRSAWRDLDGLSETRVRRQLYRGLNAVLTKARLPEPEAAESAGAGAETKAGEAERRVDARRNRQLLEQAFPGLIRPQALWFHESQLGYLFAFCGLVAAFVQGAVGRLVKRMGEPRLIVGSLGLFAVSLLILPYVKTLALLLLALALISAGSGINRAPTLGLLSMLTPPEEQGATLGVAQSASTLGRILGPLMATGIYAWNPHWAYGLASFTALAAVLVAWRGLRDVPVSGAQKPAGAEAAG
ncbi:MAG: MFS transporter [Verrucomicrobia bacterium]|nr:MAG: MFS transporter [Verrucomicrobiota bacterium]